MARKPFEPRTITTGQLQSGGFCVDESDPRFCVFGSLPGESLTAMPFTRKQRKHFARPTEIHSSSPMRVSPPCDVADLCGGCSLQHMDTNAQIEFKQTQVQAEFGDVQPLNWYEPLRGPVVGYRSKARLGVRYVDKLEKVLVGFREKLKPFIVETDQCPVLKSPMTNLPGLLSNLVSSLDIARDIPQIEVAMGEGMPALVFRHLVPMNDSDQDRLVAFGEQQQMQILLQPGNPESITKLYPNDDQQFLRYQLPEFDLTFEFLPLDFTQVNADINQRMVSRAIELLALKSTDILFDGFCGIGNFSLAAARQAKRVIGVEGSESSVLRARQNADRNGINNCVFIAQDLFAESLDISGFQDVNKVLIDPPRSGAEALCKRLASHKVEKVVYVSCNPVTLARDAKILSTNGYQFDAAGVIDMFPHTTHVESIACFSLR